MGCLDVGVFRLLEAGRQVHAARQDDSRVSGREYFRDDSGGAGSYMGVSPAGLLLLPGELYDVGDSGDGLDMGLWAGDCAAVYA